MANQPITWQPGEEERLRFKEGIKTRKKTALLDVVDALVGGNLAGLCNNTSAGGSQHDEEASRMRRMGRRRENFEQARGQKTALLMSGAARMGRSRRGELATTSGGQRLSALFMQRPPPSGKTMPHCGLCLLTESRLHLLQARFALNKHSGSPDSRRMGGGYIQYYHELEYITTQGWRV